MPVSLGELASEFGCELIGNPDTTVSNVASLQNAQEGSLTFLSNPILTKHLSDTVATAVVLRAADAVYASAAINITDEVLRVVTDGYQATAQ